VIFAADLRGGTAKGAVFGSQIFWDTDTNEQAGMSRASVVSSLRTDMEQAIEGARRDDDRVSPVFEILWGTEWLPVARSGQTVTRSARLVGPDSSYNLEFQLRR
jgi:hypothetical protein